MAENIKVFGSYEEAKTSLPNRKPIKVVIRQRSFCFVRIENEIKVFPNLCPHQRAPLSDGFITQYNEIVCPLHEYRFDLKLGMESSSRCDGLEFQNLQIQPDGVFLII